jgi:hypothetical protein
LHFLWSTPPRREPDNLSFIACSGPPCKVCAADYAALVGGGTTAEEAAALVVAHLPTVKNTFGNGEFIPLARTSASCYHRTDSANRLRPLPTRSPQ